MATKRRGGQKSGSYPRMGHTPGGGISAPTASQVLANMAAQLEAFSQEVRELKGLIQDLRARPPSRAAAYETTESLDVAAFRRAHRQRTVLLIAAAMVPLMLLAVWGLWPGPTPRRSASVVTAPAKPVPVVPQPSAALPAPVKLAEVPPPAPAEAPVRPRRAAPVRRLETIPAAPAPDYAPSRPSRSVHLNAQELSGGAPILD